jgi:hypothetical protein
VAGLVSRSCSMPNYLDAGDVTHGYAIIGHKAQVWNTCVFRSETLYREWGYVALSRGRHTGRFNQTVLDERLDEIHSNVHQPDDPHARLADPAGRRRVARPAHAPQRQLRQRSRPRQDDRLRRNVTDPSGPWESPPASPLEQASHRQAVAMIERDAASSTWNPNAPRPRDQPQPMRLLREGLPHRSQCSGSGAQKPCFARVRRADWWLGGVAGR